MNLEFCYIKRHKNLFGEEVNCEILAVRNKGGVFCPGTNAGIEFGKFDSRGVFCQGEGSPYEDWIYSEIPDACWCVRDPHEGERIHELVVGVAVDELKQFEDALGNVHFKSMEGRAYIDVGPAH